MLLLQPSPFERSTNRAKSVFGATSPVMRRTIGGRYIARKSFHFCGSSFQNSSHIFFTLTRVVRTHEKRRLWCFGQHSSSLVLYQKRQSELLAEQSQPHDGAIDAPYVRVSGGCCGTHSTFDGVSRVSKGILWLHLVCVVQCAARVSCRTCCRRSTSVSV